MTMNIAGMSPLLLDTTKFAISDLRFSPDVVKVPFRHSGNEFASVGAKPGARPGFRWKTPILAAYNYFGLKLKISTVAEIYFATFASGLRNAGALHTKLGLNTSCLAASYIDGWSINQFGIAMADIVTVLLSANGVLHPFQVVQTVSLPVLGSEPQLHTLGPYQLAGTRKDGAENNGYKLNPILHIPINDGDSFARTLAHLGSAPQLILGHEDALQMVTDLGLMGVNVASSCAIWLAGIDPTTQLRQTTGMSFTISAGQVNIAEIPFGLNTAAKAMVTIDPLSATATHPVVVATAAALP
jgi:hypothetical protein